MVMRNRDEAIQDFQRLIGQGSSVDEVVRALFEDSGFGLMTISQAVKQHLNVSISEAQRITVKATQSYMGEASPSVIKRKAP